MEKETNSKSTTTIRISKKTQELLRQLKSIKQTKMCDIIYYLAENELKKVYKLEEILNNGKNSNK